MKKNYVLLSGLILAASFGFAQNLQVNSSMQGTPKLTTLEKEIINKNVNTKAPGDTLFYEDFANQIPTGWTVTNIAANSNNWIWANTAPGGQYSTNIGALNSTTGSNGYMSLPADLYNTPFPPGGPVAMDTYFQSPAITINPTAAAVLLKFEHYQRYCCNGSNQLVAEVSNDNVNWTTINATGPVGGTRGPNTATSNAETLEFNVSGTLANQTTAYVRFRSTANSHYFWMIDDVGLYEGNANNMQLTNWDILMHNSYFYTPIYTILPIPNIPATVFELESFNAGSNVQTGATADVDVYRDSAIGGGAGSGIVYAANSTIGNGTIASLNTDTTLVTSPFFTFNPGWHSFRFGVNSDSTNQNPASSRDRYSMALTLDTVIALDRGEANYTGSSGPPSYVGGGQDGDRAAQLVIVDSVTNGFLATSISVYIANRTQNDQLAISPRIWPFHEDSATLAGAIRPPVGQSPFATVIDTSNFGSWVTLPLFPPANLTPGAYYYGVEQTGGGSVGAEMWLGRDQGQDNVARPLTSVFYLNDATPVWISPPRVLGIRLNGSFSTNVEKNVEEIANFNVFPNPNEGQFTMQVSTNTPTSYIMNVRNMVGQTVMTQPVSVNGTLNQQVDLSGFDKGVYFISLETGSDRLVKKVIVK